MASKRQRKKNMKKLGLWEGNQYRGGRTPGKKNLQRVDGGLRNQYGVVFTEEQKKALERAVNRSNRQRKKMIAEEDKLNPNASQLRLMGKESDFILARQSKSLQRFKSMEDFENFLKKQERIASGDYLLDRARLYKRNFTKSLLETYGDDAKDIAMKIRMMKPDEYMRMVASNEELEIRYVPSDMVVSGRLNQIRSILGMKLKDDWVEEEYEVE